MFNCFKPVFGSQMYFQISSVDQSKEPVDDGMTTTNRDQKLWQFLFYQKHQDGRKFLSKLSISWSVAVEELC